MPQTYTVERWTPFWADAHGIMRLHWEEIAMDRNEIELALDEDAYLRMDSNDILHVLAFRIDGVLAGYYIAFILPHVHYKHAGLMAFTDIYYILPRHRNAANGILLFTEAEESLRKRGVTKVYLSTKVHKDMSLMFEDLGWKFTDKTFTKLL